MGVAGERKHETGRGGEIGSKWPMKGAAPWRHDRCRAAHSPAGCAAALNELFHRGPYEVKASKFLSFFTLAASLPFNQPSRRQKMAPPSAFEPSLRQVSGFFWRGGGGGGTSSLKLRLPSFSRGGRGSSGSNGSPRPLAASSSFLGSEDNRPHAYIRPRPRDARAGL